MNKRLRLNAIRAKGESPEIVSAFLKRELPFGVAGEILAMMTNTQDRNALYEKVVKPLKPTKPQLSSVKNHLKQLSNGNGLSSAFANKEVKKALNRAKKSETKADAFIKQLEELNDRGLLKYIKELDEKTKTLRKKHFGAKSSDKDLKITFPPDMEKNEMVVQFRVSNNNFDKTVRNIKKLLVDKDFRDLMDDLVSPNIKACDKPHEEVRT